MLGSYCDQDVHYASCTVDQWEHTLCAAVAADDEDQSPFGPFDDHKDGSLSEDDEGCDSPSHRSIVHQGPPQADTAEGQEQPEELGTADNRMTEMMNSWYYSG